LLNSATKKHRLISHKKAHNQIKTVAEFVFCDFCAFLWLNDS
jgi:hypothetical protein